MLDAVWDREVGQGRRKEGISCDVLNPNELHLSATSSTTAGRTIKNGFGVVLHFNNRYFMCFP